MLDPGQSKDACKYLKTVKNWRKRMGIEPTLADCEPPNNGFEDRRGTIGHNRRQHCSSMPLQRFTWCDSSSRCRSQWVATRSRCGSAFSASSALASLRPGSGLNSGACELRLRPSLDPTPPPSWGTLRASWWMYARASRPKRPTGR